jgi:hypothetical protein
MYVNTYMYVCEYIHTHTHVYILHRSVWGKCSMCGSTYVHAYTHTHTFIYYTGVYGYCVLREFVAWQNLCTCMYTYTYTHVHITQECMGKVFYVNTWRGRTYVHAYTHTHTHVYILYRSVWGECSM